MSATLAIALYTWRQFARDRIFYLTLVIAALLVGFSYLLATLTIVENRKLLLDFAFSALSLAGLFVAIFLGIVAVAREIEHRLVYTMLTKPISRAAYLAGKFLGATAVLAATHFLLGLTILGLLRMNEEPVPAGFWHCVALTGLGNLVVLGFAFFASILFSSVMAAGLTFAFFLVGRSNLSLYTMAEQGNSKEVRALAGALYYLFPNLDRFNLRDVVAYGQAYPEAFVPTALVYAFAYLGVCLGLSVWLFGRRDIP